jgi:hypothetical protein
MKQGLGDRLEKYFTARDLPAAWQLLTIKIWISGILVECIPHQHP